MVQKGLGEKPRKVGHGCLPVILGGRLRRLHSLTMPWQQIAAGSSRPDDQHPQAPIGLQFERDHELFSETRNDPRSQEFGAISIAKIPIQVQQP